MQDAGIAEMELCVQIVPQTSGHAEQALTQNAVNGSRAQRRRERERESDPPYSVIQKVLGVGVIGPIPISTVEL